MTVLIRLECDQCRKKSKGGKPSGWYQFGLVTDETTGFGDPPRAAHYCSTQCLEKAWGKAKKGSLRRVANEEVSDD